MSRVRIRRSTPGWTAMRTPRPRSQTRTRAAGVLVLALVLAASWRALAGAEGIDELRGDIPSGEEIREELARIADERSELLGELARQEADLVVALAQRDELGAERQRLAEQIEIATMVVRDVAVEAYVGGGPVGDFRYLVDVNDAADLAWRQYLVRNHAGSTEQAAIALRSLRDQADEEVLHALEVAEQLRSEIGVLGGELEDLEGLVPPLEATLPIADAWDRAEIAIEEGSYGIAPAEKWEALRFCESTHNYAAINETGKYRGAYQFDLPTWRTVGGTGDPAAAPPAEQDARARELYARRGHEPWPVCGVHLR